MSVWHPTRAEEGSTVELHGSLLELLDPRVGDDDESDDESDDEYDDDNDSSADVGDGGADDGGGTAAAPPPLSRRRVRVTQTAQPIAVTDDALRAFRRREAVRCPHTNRPLRFRVMMYDDDDGERVT